MNCETKESLEINPDKCTPKANCVDNCLAALKSVRVEWIGPQRQVICKVFLLFVKIKLLFFKKNHKPVYKYILVEYI